MTNTNNLNILVIGANSAIAEAICRIYAEKHGEFHLLARNTEQTELVAKDLQVRGAKKVSAAPFDANNFEEHESLVSDSFQELGIIDLVLVAHGTLAENADSEFDFARIEAEYKTNTLSVISMLSRIAPRLKEQGSGTIAVISSVAGDRGRKSNYIYGSTKAALNAYLSGLRASLSDSKVEVCTIKPGMVSTPMTAHLEQGPLFASADKVAEDCVEAIAKKKDVIYTPWFWRYIMLIIKHIPEFIFKKLSF